MTGSTPAGAAIVGTTPARILGTPGGAVRLVTVDGYSGAGKTAWSARLGAALGAPVLSMEELYAGWSGLVAAIPLAVAWIAAPLAEGRPARWRPWDWARDARSPVWREQRPAPVVVLEGCGASAAPLRPYIHTAIWLDCPVAERERRLRTRPDWPGYAPHRELWAAQETAHFTADRTPEHADLILRPEPA